MTSATFRVVTRGLQPGYSAEMAAKQLASLFKCSEEQIAPLLGSKTVTVKKLLAHEEAKKYAQALERCGCLYSIEEESAPVDVPVGSAGKTAAPEATAPLSQQQTLSVIPVIRRAVLRSVEADAVVVQPFVGDLEVVFQMEPDGILVRQSMLSASMMSLERLYEFAVFNLYTRLHPRLTFKRMETERRADGSSGARFFMYVETGDGLESSCLLLWPIWQSVAEQVNGPLRIAVPNAGTCLFCGADDPIAFAMMSDIASETWAESGTDALSQLTYSVDAAGRVTMVPGGHLQRKAPTPHAAPLTTSAQLVSPLFHADASNATLLTLSEDRLRRLQPDLFDFAKWSNEAERHGWLERIRNTLARGDGRAAVVIDAAHGVVASYTDELDCAVLLKFDPALGHALGWQDGTRLFSANSYLDRDDGIAPDLQPGPGDTGRWGNFWPLIADLLTDDHAGLAARKQTIEEAEWERIWQLGRRANADRGAARDGRPLRCHQPVQVRPARAAAEAAPAASTRNGAGRSKRAQPEGTFGDCAKNFGIFGVCAWAVWGASRHVAEMQHDGFFYMACFGIVLFGLIGLACLQSAVNYLRGS